MPRTSGRNRAVERQLAKLSGQLREIQLEGRKGHKEGRKEARKDLRDLQAQGVQAVTQLQADGAQMVNHILTLGNQEFREVRGDLYDMNQTLTEVKTELATLKTELATLNAKVDRVLVQTSEVQAEEVEIKMRIAKLETNESLNKKRLQNVLPFSGIERGLQNVAPGTPGSASSDPVKKQEARVSWKEFNMPPDPPLVENAGARRAGNATNFASAMR